MKAKLPALFTALFTLTSFTASAADDNYRLTNDVSYLDGSIDSKQQIYYPGDTIDIRATMNGDIALLASQAVDVYVVLFNPKGLVTYKQLTDYTDNSSQRPYFIQNVNSSVVLPGTYQVALIATKPGGNPASIADWYNGLAGLLDKEALLFSETALSGDNDNDGYWDQDYDRDGFYGDDDTVYEAYTNTKTTVYKSSEYREWDDENWGDDNDSDWDKDTGNDLEWDD